MNIRTLILETLVLAPAGSMVAVLLMTRSRRASDAGPWGLFAALSWTALAFAGLSAVIGPGRPTVLPMLDVSALGLALAFLVQLLGTVIGAFSARYLEGETGQRRYVTALAGVLAAVHLLLLVDHWVILIVAWGLVGAALQRLLCFYPDRPFALLAAYKKRIADRLADGFLVAAATLAWIDVGSGSLTALDAHIAREGMSAALHGSALALVAAVVLRTALLPVHGWLIQVMEAPTPVSALLHAGVVNLGGFVLIRFAPLLDGSLPARAMLLTFGIATAVLAGMVMLTRISIKVRLAWSTVAQMGFMLAECAVGLYTLAALHLLGHSLYKAHAFLSASAVVRRTRLRALHRLEAPSVAVLALAPLATMAAVLTIQAMSGHASWPWWWSAVLGLAWAPLLWVPAAPEGGTSARAAQAVVGLAMVVGLTGAALLAHALPLGIQDRPHHAMGQIALLGMAVLYLCVAVLQRRPQALSHWWRWSYAGFYVDEAYTRLALRIWPAWRADPPVDDPSLDTLPPAASR
jgi:NAD(P)H-quinone oxidoreductase subunit 5